MSEVEFHGCSKSFTEATSDEAREAIATRAGAILEGVEGDLFMSAEEVRASLTASCSGTFLAAITACTPKLAAAAVRGRLWKGVGS